MNADEIRLFTKESIENAQELHRNEVNINYDAVMSSIKLQAENGCRSIIMNMGGVYYSTIFRLVSEGYYFEDIPNKGSVKVSW